MTPAPTVVLSVLGEAPSQSIAAAAFAAWLARSRGVTPFLAPAWPADGSLLRLATGKAPRRLDSWLMAAPQVRSQLASPCDPGDWPLVVGSGGDSLEEEGATGLAELVNWLGAAEIGVLKVGDLSQLPSRPPRPWSGLILSGLSHPSAALQARLELEARWHMPVLGWVHAGAGAESAQQLAGAFAAGCDLRAWIRWEAAAPRRKWGVSGTLPVFPRGARIALPSGGLCFPETLDLLQQAGAELCEFSLHGCDRLPDDADLVYLGPALAPADLHAASVNPCLQQSLRGYAAQGGRIFAEGAGAALLAREVVLHRPGGEQSLSLAGVLPLRVRWSPHASGCATPTMFDFGLASWLAPCGAQWRGRCDAALEFQPCGGLLTYARHPAQRLDMVGRQRVLASRIFFHPASNRALAQALLASRQPAPLALGRQGQ